MIKLRTLGSIDVRSADGRALRSVLSQPKRLALFAYLALAHPGTLRRRDTLVGLFWPELSEERARAALRKSLHYLRRSLGEDVLVGHGEEAVGIAADAVWCDVAELERALAAGDPVRALELYGGDLLAGLYVSDAPEFERWLDARRWELRDRAAQAAWDVADRELAAGNPVGAAHWGRRAFAIASFSEAALQRLVRLLDALGDRAGALLAFEEFAHRLAAEELSPARDTLALVREVRARAERPPAPIGPPPAPEPVARTSHPPAGTEAASEPTARAADAAPREAMPRRRAVRFWGVTAGALLLAVVLAIRADPRATALERHGLAPNVPVVLADFASSDEGLARAVTEAVRIDLSRSQRVRPVDAQRVAEALVRMERDPLAPLDDATARELARREGFPAVIAGSVLPAGSGYLLAAQVVATADGAVLASERLTAPDSSRILASIDRLSKALRRAIGESARQLRREPRLEQVTTSNLRALESFSLALRMFYGEGDLALATSLLENAVELDSTFAAAQTTLGLMLYARDDRTRGLRALTTGYENRHRLPERERLWISAHYHRTVAGDLERAAHAYESLIELEAERAPASDLHDLHAEYATLLLSLRQDARAEQHARTAVALDSTGRWAGQRALTEALVYRGAFDVAAASLARYIERHPRHPLARLQLGEVQAARGQLAAAQSTYVRLRGSDGGSAAPIVARRLADLAAARGRLDRAAEMLDAAVAGGARRGAAGRHLEAASVAARLEAEVAHRPERAVALLEAALQRHPLDSIPPLDRPYRQVAAAFAAAGASARARELLRAAAAGRGQRAASAETAATEGMLALAERRVEAAVAAFRRADTGRCRVCSSAGLARAFDLGGQQDSAVAAYERYLTTPDIDRVAADAFYLGPTYERLAGLYEARGDRATAASYYQRFISLWADADAVLQPRVRSARARLHELTRVAAESVGAQR